MKLSDSQKPKIVFSPDLLLSGADAAETAKAMLKDFKNLGGAMYATLKAAGINPLPGEQAVYFGKDSEDEESPVKFQGKPVDPAQLAELMKKYPWMDTPILSMGGQKPKNLSVKWPEPPPNIKEAQELSKIQEYGANPLLENILKSSKEWVHRLDGLLYMMQDHINWTGPTCSAFIGIMGDIITQVDAAKDTMIKLSLGHTNPLMYDALNSGRDHLMRAKVKLLEFSANYNHLDPYSMIMPSIEKALLRLNYIAQCT